MRDLDFTLLLLEHWSDFLIINGIIFALLHFSLKKILVGGIFDPLFLVFVVGFSTNYSVVLLLFIYEEISYYLFAMVCLYVSTFIAVFVYFSKKRACVIYQHIVNFITGNSSGKHEYWALIVVYFIVSVYVISNIGFGFFSDTNRFENSRGFGAFVRVLDLLSVFLVAYSTLLIAKLRYRTHKILYGSLLAIFIMYSAILNGAKISILFSSIVVVFSLKIEGYRVNLNIRKTFILLIVGILFMLLALNVNLENNNIDSNSESKYIPGTPLLVESFLHRMIANGNTSYLLLPNKVIDHIEKDHFIVRFLAPVIGITQLSRLLQYNVADYSVGRQALLYFDSNVDIAGGPTSHFDLFAYVYFGLVGGWIFIILLAYLLGSLNYVNRFKFTSGIKNTYISAILTTFWVRSIIVVVEPTVGIAYVIDILVVFIFLSIYHHFLMGVLN